MHFLLIIFKQNSLINTFLLSVFLIFCIATVQADHVDKSKKLETVNLQLKWIHQFQFAGYYAAKEQGYYADEGLDVHIHAFNSDKPVVKQIVSGDADYGVGDVGILFNYAKGDPVKALAAIFQHNPLVFISKRSSGIVSPYEMLGKQVMQRSATDDAPLRAMLANADININQYSSVTHNFRIQDLIQDKVDVMSGYITDQPYAIKQEGIEINIIHPQNYGVDFYGDLLFTSDQELEQHPGRAERFLSASLKGWKYAFEHSEQLVQLISQKYNSKSSVDRLRSEAKETRKLVLPDTVPLGQIKVERLRHVNNIYSRLNLSRKLTETELSHFVHHKNTEVNLNAQERQWLQQHPVIRLGIDKHFAPYESITKDDRYEGIAADYIKLIEQRLGIKFTLIKDKNTWHEVLDAAKKGELDLLSCLVKTPEREAFLNFSEPYLNSSAVIISEQSKGYIGSLEQLRGQRVAIQKGHYTQELLAKNYPDISIISTANIAEALTMVSTGKADAYVGDVTSASYVMKKKGFVNLIFSGSTPYQSQFRFAAHKNNPVLTSIINKTLETISQHERDEIFDHWRTIKITQGVKAETIIKYALLIACLFLLVGYWIYSLRQSKEKLKASQTKLQLILDTEPECVKILDAEGCLVQMNPAGLRMIDVKDASTVIGKKVDGLVVEEYRQAFNEMTARVLKGKKCTLEYQIKGLSGKILWVDANAVPLIDEKTKAVSVLAVTRDITETKKAMERIWEQANYDSLTQLPNRSMFLDRLDVDIKVALRSEKPLAVIFLDLDHFKEVNDTLGHDKGDELLCEAAKRITFCVREADTVARVGGDEFIIILAELDDTYIIDRVAQEIICTLSQSFDLADNHVYVSASLGIAMYPNDADNSTGLIKHADQAMYLSKEQGRNRYSYFTKSMQDQAQFRMLLMNDMRSALATEQFELYYQPIVDLVTGDIVKAEALIRWNHPARGMVSPADFIPLAEESGLIIEIGDWVFKQAAKQVKSWRDTYNKNLQVSINKSPVQFRAATDRNDWLNYLKEIGLSGAGLAIEITEGLLMDNSENISDQLLQYRDAGIQVSLDDFGTGYSALSYLNKFDIDYLKIDQSFTRNLVPGSNDMALSEAIILMAHTLGLKVIAEGIETELQQQLLIDAGCNYGQGYLFSKPIPADEFEVILMTSTKG